MIFGWLLALGILFSRFTYVVASTTNLFFFTAESYSILWLQHILFIHSSADEHLGCLSFLDIMNKTAINIHVQICVWTSIFISLRCMPRSRITGPYENSTFDILRNSQTVFQGSYTIVLSHPPAVMSVLISTLSTAVILGTNFYIKYQLLQSRVLYPSTNISKRTLSGLSVQRKNSPSGMMPYASGILCRI